MMEKYDKYKPSGISWLPAIPEHWEVKKLKLFCKENKQKNIDNLEKTVLSLSYGNIIVKNDLTFGLVPGSYETYQIVEPNNIILRLTDLQNDHRSLRTGLVKNRGVITNAYVGLIINQQNAEYIHLLLHTYDILKVFYSMGGGLRQSMSYQDVANMYICLPPLPEQQAIVSYLDGETKKIDEFIEKKEKEAAYLDELKQSVIAQTVTQGLDHSVPMKPSGISWLGNIHQHWEVIKMQYLFDERSEKNHPDEQPLCSTQAYGVIPQSMYENRVVIVNKGLEGQKLVKVGDFVISLRSFQGGIEYAYYQGVISAAYTILTPKKVEYADYYKLLFKSHDFIQLLQTCVTGIREGQNINYSMLKKKGLPVPPLPEQQAIVSYLNDKCGQIDKMKANIDQEIEYLKEYKQRLIADVVTGQIKVC